MLNEQLNEMFIDKILELAKRGIFKNQLNEIGIYSFKLTTKEVATHIKVAKTRGLYSVPNMSLDLKNTYYQF
jgi:hypothetical protein